ncbi:PAS-domain containing protein [Pseudooceanicola sp. CBS1P-1]|nr:PAS-domain containing protein [Pseudooceanicola endophyticus]
MFFMTGSDMTGITPSALLLAIVFGLLMAGACLVILGGVGRRTLSREEEPGDLPEAPTASVFIFDEQHLVSLPRDWQALLDSEPQDTSDWTRLRGLLAPRFPGLPEQPEVPGGKSFARLDARPAGDRAVLRLRQSGRNLRLTLCEASPATVVDRHLSVLRTRQLDSLDTVLEDLPIPSWSVDGQGAIVRRNAAYRALESRISGAEELTAPLVRGAEEGGDRPEFTYRVMLDPRGRMPERWLDVSARRNGDGWDCAAQDVTALVKAEVAQRNFVQTLTKTFAQLSTGLAIFDRDRQLILFNPALVDLTALSPEFLTGRPALSQFFDHLRDRQIMPEPKNYASWREQINALVSAAADGRYQETWSLPNGATYRVTGRPHPNGAIAFLFEDITDEIAITRRFRQQLSLSQSVLDAMTDSIVIFDAQGMMSYCNAAYRRMFGLTPEDDLSDISVRDAHDTWSRRAAGAQGLDELMSRVLGRSGRETWHGTARLKDAGEVSCSALPLVSGACMVTFGRGPQALPAPLAERPEQPATDPSEAQAAQ